MPFVTRKTLTKPPQFGGVDLDAIFAEETKRQARPERPRPRIIAIGSGSGGIGKTVVSTLLSATLAQRGYETVLIDADFACANLYDQLKTSDSEKTLRNYLERKSEDINELAVPTRQQKMRLITGSPSIAQYQHLTYAAKQRLLRNIDRLAAKFVVIDLGAGSTYTNLDFFLLADDPVIITTCDSSSLQDAYGFVRVGLFRKLQKSGRAWPDLYAQFITLGDLQVKGDILTVDMFLQEYQTSYPAICAYIQRAIASFRPKLIVNNIQASDDRSKLQTFRLVVQNILGINVKFWGEIRADEFISEAVKLTDFNLLLKAPAAADVEKIVSTHLFPAQTPNHVNP